MARDRGDRAGLYRICDRPHRILGSARRLAEQTSDARSDRCRDRPGAIVNLWICSTGRRRASLLSPRRATDRNVVPLWRAKAMQLGMIGLGRMGGNMVRRLLKGGHQCVVYNRSANAVAELVKEKAVGTTSLPDFVKKLSKAARSLADGADRRGGQCHRRSAAPSRTRRHPHRRRQFLLHRRHSPRQRAKIEGHTLCGRRHQRRRLGTGARLLHDDRWRAPTL